MSEPKVEFDLNNISSTNQELLKVLDGIRRWFKFREDRGTPAMQSFKGSMGPGEQVNLFVPGKVYGAVGMTQFSTNRYWIPMAFSIGVAGDRVGFGIETDNSEGNFVTLRTASGNDREYGYRVTVFYIGNSNAN